MKSINEALAQIDFSPLQPEFKALFSLLINKMESQEKTIHELRVENQKLKDEINRLKGEQGKPDIRPQSKDKDISSEKERKSKNADGSPKSRKPKNKNDKIKINRTQRCTLDKSTLPYDVVLSGLHRITLQDIIISTDNVLFECEEYYSTSLKKTFTAPVPKGYEGQFGPQTKALIRALHHDSKMPLKTIVSFFETFGIFISKGTVSRFLTDNIDDIIQESKDIVAAGLASAPHKQLDDTGARVKGKNWYTHILCNLLFTSYHTRPKKSRLTVIDILRQGELTFCLNDISYTLMTEMKVPGMAIKWLKEQEVGHDLKEQELTDLLLQFYPDPKKHIQIRKSILDAAAIGAYRQWEGALGLILVDDAPQFKGITENLGLCWIHDGRSYKKLSPFVYLNEYLVEKFLDDFWNYYRKLLAYKENPTTKKVKKLEKDFDKLFSRKTGYDELDERIAMTKAKKKYLLLVLKYPNLPLHNNESELAARDQARRRDINYHTMSAKGTTAKDAFMTIVATARKHSVNVFDYFLDRITKKYEMPSLAELISQKNALSII